MFGALRSRNFALLLAGSFTANVGIWMQSVAMGWLIYDLTDSASWLGRVGFAQSAPTLFFGLLGGALTEHADRKRVMAGSALLYAAGALTLALLTITGRIEIWMILTLSVVTGTATALYMPVFQASIPSLVPPEHLMNAISLNSVSFNVARVIGPLVAGAVMAIGGTGWCFATNGVGFLILVGTIFGLRMPERGVSARGPLGRTLLEGFDYARRHPRLRLLLLMCVTLSLFGFPFVVLMPALARSVLDLDAGGFTRLFSAVGVGAVVGGLGLARAGDFERKGELMLVSGACFGTLLIVVAQTTTFFGAALTFLLLGACMIVCIASLNTLVQVTVSEEMRARVMSMVTVSLFGLPTLGGWVLGTIADRVGIPLVLSVGGAMVAAVSAGLLTFAPGLRSPGLPDSARP